MSKSFQIRIDMSGFNRFVQNLGDAVAEAVRPAAQAGAQVIYDQAKTNVASIGRRPDGLADAIYQKYSEDNSGPLKAVYHVSWNAKKAPHGRLVEWGFIQRYATYWSHKKGDWRIHVRMEKRGQKPPKRRGRPPYSHKQAMGEHYVLLKTPKQIPARPFMRSAIAAKAFEAKQAMRDRFFDELRKKLVR